jgi:hypothetical protein
VSISPEERYLIIPLLPLELDDVDREQMKNDDD